MFLDKNKLYVFIDAMPSEQGSTIQDDHISYTAILYSGNEEKLEDLKQYKDLSKKGRIETSKLICELIDSDQLWILTSCVTCQSNIAEENGNKLLSSVLGVNEEEIKNTSSLVINNQKINIKRAKMYANYAIALAFLSGHLAQYIQHYECKSGYFVLDLLPGDQITPDHQPGLEIVKWLTDKSSFLKMVWKDSSEEAKGNEIGFCYAKVMPEIGFSLSDWVAQSCHATINADSFRSNVKRKKEDRRRVAANIIFSVMEQYKKRDRDPEKIFFQIPLLSGFK